MKKIIYLFTFLIITFFAVSNVDSLKSEFTKLTSYSVCDQPIHYRIDTVDTKFNLSKGSFINDVNQAAQIWSRSEGKNLFVYDPKGDLSVNLIYDERQSLTNQVNQLENKVSSDKQSLNPQISEYEKQSADFKQKADDLNRQIEYWNSKGGAPEDEYNKLIQQQKDLQAQADNLNKMAQSLSISTQEYNSQIGQLNQTIGDLNNALSARPEEGIFKGPENRIEIYFDISQNELIHTLAHELGHSLGLNHIENTKAIMYFRTNQTIIPTADDKQALRDLCKRHTILDIIQTAAPSVFNNIIQHIQTLGRIS